MTEEANGNGTADTEPPESEDTHPGGDPVTEIVFPKDEGCFMCVGLPDHPPEEDKTMNTKEFLFAYGFALGVATVLRSAGPFNCTRHRGIIRRALQSQGVNWSPDAGLSAGEGG